MTYAASVRVAAIKVPPVAVNVEYFFRSYAPQMTNISVTDAGNSSSKHKEEAKTFLVSSLCFRCFYFLL